MNGFLQKHDQPMVMGIINVTPDSFYNESKIQSKDELLYKTETMVKEGVDILDIGGYSSRPGAEDVTLQEELERVLPAVQSIIKEFGNVKLSIDTFRSKVAIEAVKEGVSMINDISGGEGDKAMFKTVGELRVPYVLMHMRGTPATMNTMTTYDDLLSEITDYFVNKVESLRGHGVNDIIVDPGFGFAKSIDQNYEILRNLNYFNILNCPILVGISRKSMIYNKLGVDPSKALNGTSVLNTIALIQGASMLRVHDVKEAKETIRLYQEVYK